MHENEIAQTNGDVGAAKNTNTKQEHGAWRRGHDYKAKAKLATLRARALPR
jgi:hypothetical protein